MVVSSRHTISKVVVLAAPASALTRRLSGVDRALR